MYPADSLVSAVVRPEEAAQALAEWDAAPGRVFRILVDFTSN